MSNTTFADLSCSQDGEPEMKKKLGSDNNSIGNDAGIGMNSRSAGGLTRASRDRKPFPLRDELTEDQLLEADRG